MWGRIEVNRHLASAKKTLENIDKMEVKVSSTLPGKCLTYRTNPVEGNVEFSGTRKFSFQPLDGSKPYVISSEAGWTDGNPYIPNSGHAKGYVEGNNIICIER